MPCSRFLRLSLYGALAGALLGSRMAGAGGEAVHGRAAIWAYLAERYDRDRDGAITQAEYARGAERFAHLDQDGDGTLTRFDFRGPTTMDRYVARAILMRFLQADRVSDELSRRELCVAFRARDLNGDGRLRLAELQRVRRAFRGLHLGAPDMPAGVLPWPHVREAIDRNRSGDLDLCELLAFFDSEDAERSGRWRRPARSSGPSNPQGPAEGELAPSFELTTPDGTTTVSLESLRGRPVVLAFGSYT